MLPFPVRRAAIIVAARHSTRTYLGERSKAYLSVVGRALPSGIPREINSRSPTDSLVTEGACTVHVSRRRETGLSTRKRDDVAVSPCRRATATSSSSPGRLARREYVIHNTSLGPRQSRADPAEIPGEATESDA